MRPIFIQIVLVVFTSLMLVIVYLLYKNHLLEEKSIAKVPKLNKGKNDKKAD
jgi:hypothetical protein